jgi:hypothetical protein
MNDTTTQPPLDRRCKQAHPERIVIGGKTLERNDVVAKRYGESERSTNRRDRQGAPYIFISNIKYRPQPDYDEFILARIVRRPRLGRAGRAKSGARAQSDAARLETARQREQTIAAGKAAARSPKHINARRAAAQGGTP